MGHSRNPIGDFNMLEANEQAQKRSGDGKEAKSDNAEGDLAEGIPEAAAFADADEGDDLWRLRSDLRRCRIDGRMKGLGGGGLVELGEEFEAMSLALAGAEDAFLAVAGVVDECGLPGEAKEALVEENIHFGEEDAVTWVGVIPADDAEIGILLIHLELDVLPGVGGEGDLSGAAGRRLAFDDVLDEEESAGVVLIDIADQDAADFGAGRGIAVRVDAVEGGLAEDDLEGRGSS